MPICSWYEEVLQIRGHREPLIVADPKALHGARARCLHAQAEVDRLLYARHDDERADPR